ncbi:hypothetical protein STEG23_024584 [Scotinomys teguina]
MEIQKEPSVCSITVSEMRTGCQGKAVLVERVGSSLPSPLFWIDLGKNKCKFFHVFGRTQCFIPADLRVHKGVWLSPDEDKAVRVGHKGRKSDLQMQPQQKSLA